ncbi:beta-lactamase class A [Labrenzia sp. EL_126]|nr:beta-lactamase class A [Labrenzia sp. EL_126]
MTLSIHKSALVGILLPFLTLGSAQATDFNPRPVAKAIEDIETRLSARVGVSIIDTESGKTWSHKGDERFPMNSTFKAFLCAAFLDAASNGTVDAGREVVVEESDIVSYSPVTAKRVGGAGFTIEDLCRVTVTISDNAAANIVMKEVGGPDGVTAYLRGIGDDISRVDRWEPESNTGIPGDDRDTTTPDAAAETLRKLVLDETLAEDARAKLTGWLEGNKVGNSTLRAGLPEGWRIADKTGAGANGSRNNIAVIWPEGRKPLVIAIYITQTTAAFEARNKAIASIAQALPAALQP